MIKTIKNIPKESIKHLTTVLVCIFGDYERASITPYTEHKQTKKQWAENQSKMTVLFRQAEMYLQDWVKEHDD